MTFLESLGWTVGILAVIVGFLFLLGWTVKVFEDGGEWYEMVAIPVIWILLVATFVWWLSGMGGKPA